jgi:REase_MTES_1575/Protein of unknown function (DUF3320)
MYLLGIECDGATYHSSRSARDRDRLRQEILESRGWRIYRIWSTDWFHRRKHEEHRLLDALERASKTPPPPKPIASEPVEPPSPVTVDPSPAPPDPPIGTPYIEANFRIRSDDAPHEAPKEKVAEAVFRILEIESPIHEDELCRRLASVWGLERTGSRIREAGLTALKRLKSSGRATNKAAFWTGIPARPVEVRNRASVENVTLRKPEYLPPEEIVEAARQIVAESVRAPMADIVIEVARRFGIQRASQEIQDSIRKALGSKLAADLVVDDQGNVVDGPHR